MKIKKEFCLTAMEDEYLLVATGKEAKRVKGMLRLNNTGGIITRMFQKETTIPEAVDALLAEYEVERPVAEEYVDYIVGKLREIGALEE